MWQIHLGPESDSLPWQEHAEPVWLLMRPGPGAQESFGVMDQVELAPAILQFQNKSKPVVAESSMCFMF